MNDDTSMSSVKGNSLSAYVCSPSHVDSTPTDERLGPLLDKIIEILCLSTGIATETILEKVIDGNQCVERIVAFCKMLMNPSKTNLTKGNLRGQQSKYQTPCLLVYIGSWKDSENEIYPSGIMKITVNERLPDLQSGDVYMVVCMLSSQQAHEIDGVTPQSNDQIGPILTFTCTQPINDEVTKGLDKEKTLSLESDSCRMLDDAYMPYMEKMKPLIFGRLAQSVFSSNQIVGSIEWSVDTVHQMHVNQSHNQLNVRSSGNDMDSETDKLMERAVMLLSHGKDASSIIMELSLIPSIVRRCELSMDAVMSNVNKITSKLGEIRWQSINCPERSGNRKLIGLEAELEFWRSATVQLATLVRLISVPKFKLRVYIVRAAVSSTKLLQWFQCEKYLVRDSCRAQENFKYLFSLSRICSPLYGTDLSIVKQFLPSLMHSVKIICRLSKFYSQSQPMSDLLLCICAQLVQCCKKCILHNLQGRGGLQDLDIGVLELVEEICLTHIDLNNELMDLTVSGTREKAASSMPLLGHVYQATEASENVSREYTFSPIKMFIKRIREIIYVRRIISQYGSQFNKSTFRYFWGNADRLQAQLDNLLSCANNILHTHELVFADDDQTFDIWFDSTFRVNLDTLNNSLIESLQGRMHDAFKSKCNSMDDVLTCLVKINGMDIPVLEQCVADMYSEVIQYLINIEFPRVVSIYESEKLLVAASHKRSETAEQIIWARGLYNRLKKPVQELLKVNTISTAELDLLKREFDKRAQVFIMHELVIHKHWLQSVQNLPNLLKCPIFIKLDMNEGKSVDNDSSGQYDKNEEYYMSDRNRTILVNFDPFVTCVANTTRELSLLNIQSPSICLNLLHFWPALQNCVLTLFELTQTFNKIEFKSHNRVYKRIFKMLIWGEDFELYNVVKEGRMCYNWMSSNLQDFVDKYTSMIESTNYKMNCIDWLISNRIHKNIDNLFADKMITVPSPNSKYFPYIAASADQQKHKMISIRIDDFVQMSRKETTTKASYLASLNSKIENAVKDLTCRLYELFQGEPFLEMELFDTSSVKLGRLGKLQQSIIQTFAITDEGLQRLHKRRSLASQSKHDEERVHNYNANITSEIRQIWNYYESRMVQGLIYATNGTLQRLRKRVVQRPVLDSVGRHVWQWRKGNAESRPSFCADVLLANSAIFISPSIEEHQKSLNECISYVINVSRGIKRWGQHNEVPITEIHNEHYPGRLDGLRGDIAMFHLIAKRLQNVTCNQGELVKDPSMSYNLFETPLATYYYDVINDVEISRIRTDLSTCLLVHKDVIDDSLQHLYEFAHIWDPSEQVWSKFLNLNKGNFELMPVLNGLCDLGVVIKAIGDINNFQDIFPLRLLLDNFKGIALQLAIEKKTKVCEHVKNVLSQNTNEVHNSIQRVWKKLEKPLISVDNFKTVLSGIILTRQMTPKLERSCTKLMKSMDAIDFYNRQHQQKNAEDVRNNEKIEELRRSFEQLLSKSEAVHRKMLIVKNQFVSNLKAGLEEFKAELDAFDSQYQLNGPMVSGMAAHEASDRMRLFSSKFEILWSRYISLYESEQLFNVPHSQFNRLYTLKKELASLGRLYALFDQANQTIDKFKDTQWANIDANIMTDELSDLMTRCKRMPTSLKKWPAYQELQELITNFMEKIPLLDMLSNEAMQRRHWQGIEAIFDCEFNVTDENFQVGQLTNVEMLGKKEQIEDICIRAMKEREIENKLKMLDHEWRNREFKLAPFKSRGEILLKGQDTSDAISSIEDSNLILAGLSSNRYNEHFKADIQKFIDDLGITYEVTTKWIQVQNLWVYLEAVFIGGDISRQLPLEARRFAAVDKMWLKMIAKARETPNILSCCISYDNNLEMLDHMFAQLEICQTSLAGYLESKRQIFPRFYFLSDTVLLEILGQASEPAKLQPYFASFTESVSSVIFDELSTRSEDLKSGQHSSIVAIQSDNNEVMQLVRPVYTKKTVVEEWLNDFLRCLQETVRKRIENCVSSMGNNDFDLHAFFMQEYQQFGIIILQLLWTATSESAIKNQSKIGNSVRKANKYFQILLNELIDKTLQDLSPVDRLKYETYITIHIHQRDVFNELANTGIKDVRDFDWSKQSRFYYEDATNSMLVSITDVDFMYGNEFLGCSERLVITPLTDRCYISLAQALGMCYGGSPAGPAGTGKTETTKDMAKAIGKYCVVQNCSEQFDYKGLGKTFKGLAQSGCWGCFDEFNRINLPVLSVAAQQIQTLFEAKRKNQSEFTFTDGQTIKLDPAFAVVITMNPGYAGRQELPENLKVNFRVVAMMVPDRQIIIRVKLASSGFRENIVLSQKFYLLYKLCEDQLSKQVHYDFGMRNVRAVLWTLGTAKRQNPNEPESIAVLRVLRDMNLSKLVDEDESLFLSLLNDLFPSITLKTESNQNLQEAIDVKCKELNLVNDPQWNHKIVQLYDTQLVRHGIMVLGPSGVGKSTCIEVLEGALTIMGIHTREYRMNPKAITSTQMFGALDVSTNDWTDGIFSTLWRRFLKLYSSSVKKQRNEMWWMVLDGPVDAVWIENLNSVLDDNKLLTLANGDRIPMAPNVKVIFEVHNIDNASPATVSRNGMVYMSRSTLPWSAIAKSWLQINMESRYRKQLYNLLENTFENLYNYVRTSLFTTIPTFECNFINQILAIADGSSVDQDETFDSQVIQLFCTYAIIYGFATLIDVEDIQKFCSYLYANTSDHLQLPSLQYDETDNISSAETVLDYFVNSDGQWQTYSTIVDEWLYPLPTEDSIEYSAILVPNVDNVRTLQLLELIAVNQRPVMLIGEQGTAKTVIMNRYLSQYDLEKTQYKIINFSSTTTPNQIQRTFESYFEKRYANTIGPGENKHMTIFIDDISMPMINEWGDQIANEIVRQLIEYKGFYSLDKPGEWINVADIQFAAAMIKPGSGRNDIPERLRRHFVVISCGLPGNSAIDKIFNSIAYYFHSSRDFNEDIINAMPLMVSGTRNIWQTVKTKMLPTPAKFHYIFNLRDLSRIWEGMIRIKSEECPNITELLHLWRHECSRVLADRFIDESELKWFTEALNDETSKLNNAINESINMRLSNQLDSSNAEIRDIEEGTGDMPRVSTISTHEEDVKRATVARSEENSDIAKLGDVIFCDFQRDEIEITDENVDDFNDEVDLQPRVYERVIDLDKVRQIVINNMNRMNEEIRGNNMDLVFFEDSIRHLLRIVRIIQKPIGHGLLVGVGGSGKRSLASLATYICGYKLFKIAVTRTYNVNAFLEDMKSLYKLVSKSEKGVSFILADSDINDEQYLEYVNNMLNSAEIPGLLSKEEMEPMLNELAFVIKKQSPKAQLSKEALVQHFWKRIRSNLHIIMCFSPENKKFRDRAMKFPGIISACTVDWFHKWPLDALKSVSSHFLQPFEMDCRPVVKTSVIKVMSQVHFDMASSCAKYFDLTRRTVSVTPKSFLSFISMYKDYYLEKREYYESEKAKMKIGIDKLLEAADQVNEISKELVEKAKDIEVLNNVAAEELKSTEGIKRDAEQQSDKVEKIKLEALTIVDKISQQKAQADKEMEPAKHVLDECKKALLEITKSDIDYLKKLPNPPQLIMIIIDSILILLRYRVGPISINMNVGSKLPPFYHTNNSEINKMLSHPQIMKMLYELDPDELNDEMLELTGAYFKYKGYDYDMARNVFKNLAALTNWAKKTEEYYDKNKVVLPLKNNVKKMEGRYKRAQDKLQRAEQEFQKTNDVLQKCLVQYKKAMGEKKIVQDKFDKLQNRRDTAANLIDGLMDERKRWSRQSVDFERTIKKLPGDVLLSSAFVSYAGPFNQLFRQTIVSNWNQLIKKERIPMSDKFNISTDMVEEAVVNEWNIQGLPADTLSTENGIIMTSSNRYPLLIDPQIQGLNWITNKEANSLVVTQMHSRDFKEQLENALSYGHTLLIQDAGDDLDPALEYVLDKKYFKLGTSLKCKVADRDVDVNTDFKLYITTKLPNPEFSPEIFARCAVIDFAVTLTGLEEQLLAIVINHERAEIERDRVTNAKEMSVNQRRLKELENSLLAKLTSIKGSVLDDPELIRVLNENKSTASEIKQKMIMSEKTRVKLQFAREEYRSVAIRGSVLYFIFTEMALVNYMYQCSLHQFLDIFRESMSIKDGRTIQKNPSAGQRAIEISNLLTELVWSYMSRGIYRSDRVLFTLIIALKIKLRAGEIKNNEFMALVKGGASIDLDSCPPNKYAWIDDPTWMNIIELSKIQRFRGILQHIRDNEAQWKQWHSSFKIEEILPPMNVADGVNHDFDRLLMVRTWSPARILMAVQRFIAQSIGKYFVQPYILNLDELVNESSPKKPILALLSSGNDPTSNIVSLASEYGKEISIVALGQGQEPQARAALSFAMETGNWMLLQNCHLGLEYMLEFYTEIMNNNADSGFRAWMTTESHPNFPIQVLHCAIKFTNEAPQGIRAGLIRTYSTISQHYLDSLNAKPWSQLVYVISYMNSIFQERRRYGPIGWNVPYEFSQTDWEASLKYIRNMLMYYDRRPVISWKALRYMISEIQYGGRVTDEMDRRLMIAYSKLWMKESLLQGKFDFCPPDNTYIIPESKRIADVNHFLTNLPVADKARAFGLHSNSDMSYQIRQANYALSTIVSIQPKEESADIVVPTSRENIKTNSNIHQSNDTIQNDVSREATVHKLAGDMLKKLPECLSEQDIKRRLHSMGTIQPMSIFLSHEIARMQKLLRLTKKLLTEVRSSIEGVIVLSDELKNVIDCIYDARVPPTLIRHSWVSAGLGFWFNELLSRYVQFESWVRKGRPKLFWFAGFFNPAGFLTAMRQEITRMHKDWALDFVGVESSVTRMNKEDVKQAPSEGVFIHGLFLEGASWDSKNGRLCESISKIIYNPMPVIHMYAVNNRDIKAKIDTTPQKGIDAKRATQQKNLQNKRETVKISGQFYECPVYRRAARTDANYITSIKLNSGVEDPLHWILRGAALLSNIN